MRNRAVLGIATGLYGLLAAYSFGPLFGSGGPRFVDFRTLYGEFAMLGLSDTRLNTWILGWVQHSLLSDPRGLFDANVFHPAMGTLAGSEHMIGVALLMLPLRIFTSDAVLIHQASLVVSALILAGTSAALVRWLTGSAWIAITAGAVAMFMPWRTTELMHLQLMSAHWIPLIWLLAFRILLGEARRRDPWLLGLVLSLQLLSSYYLAYQVTLSLAVVTLLGALQARAGVRSLARLAAAAAPAYALLACASLPYLAGRSRGVIPEMPPIPSEFPGAMLFAMPRWTPLWNPLATSELAYSVPILVALLALVALLLPVRAGAAGGCLASAHEDRGAVPLGLRARRVLHAARQRNRGRRGHPSAAGPLRVPVRSWVLEPARTAALGAPDRARGPGAGRRRTPQPGVSPADQGRRRAAPGAGRRARGRAAPTRSTDASPPDRGGLGAPRARRPSLRRPAGASRRPRRRDSLAPQALLHGHGKPLHARQHSPLAPDPQRIHRLPASELRVPAADRP